MSLTTSDLQEIRSIVDYAFTKQTDEYIRPLKGEIQALRSDIKELYDMIFKLESTGLDKKFDKLTLEEKILTLNTKLVYAAKQAGITLPR